MGFRLRLFAPRDFARTEIRLTKQRQSQVCLSARSARVTQAWVEFSENVIGKSGCGFVQLLPPKADFPLKGTPPL